MKYQTRVWLHGLVAACLNGVANSVVLVMVDPLKFNLFQGGARELGIAAVASAVFAFFTYLKTHPLPDPEKDVDYVTVQAQAVATMEGTGDGSLPRVLPMIAALVLGASLLAGCASVPVKQHVSAKHQTVHQALVILDDAERALCQPKPAPLSNECASPTAAAIGLTNAKHQEFSRKLAAAFALDAKVGAAVIAWRAGDPVPADLSTLFRDAQDIAAVANTITDNPLVDKAQTLIARLLQLIDAFKN